MDKKNDFQERLDGLREAAIYAPLGLLYEYDDVMPKLVRRGKSQVQIAKLVGKAATGRPDLEKNVTNVANHVSGFLAKAFLEAGELLGLTPDTEPQKTDAAAQTASSKSEHSSAVNNTTIAEKPSQRPTKNNKSKAKQQSTTLPIAGYDKLTAKEILQLVGDLSPTQRTTILKHELANRSRKTVLAKLNRLEK